MKRKNEMVGRFFIQSASFGQLWHPQERRMTNSVGRTKRSSTLSPRMMRIN
jgi:hypothetical protein